MKLVRQITAAMLATLLLVVALVAASLYVSVERGFARYVRGLEEARLEPAVSRLQKLYARDRSWESLVRNPGRLGDMLRREEGEERKSKPTPAGAGLPPPGDDREGPPRPVGAVREEPRGDSAKRGSESPEREGNADPPVQPRSRPGPTKRDTDPLELRGRTSLYDAKGAPLVGTGSLEGDASKLRLVVDGETVGWLGVRAIPQYESKLDLQYLQQVRNQLVVIVVVAVLLGILGGWLLARQIVRPIDRLRACARRLATGDTSARMALPATDEIGQLATDFDTLAATLAADERARRRWVADTSHELRTPITVLRAEVEALLDGVRPTDTAAIVSLHGELQRLGKLVDDLGELARADRGTPLTTKVPVEPMALLDESLGAFRVRLERRRMSVRSERIGVEAVRVLGDGDRLRQVFDNLLENSVRYTEEGGTLRIGASLDGDSLVLVFDDSAPGVSSEALEHLFDRFFRGEASRSREHGGSGLGLSICQRLVQLHGGTIGAAASPLGGLRIEIRLPLLGAKGGAAGR